MSYSELYTQQHSRPSQILIAIALFATISAVGYYFLSSSTPTRASKQVLIQHQPVNVFPRQAGIFWEVTTSDEGWIVYGENPSKLDQIALDERDIPERGERKYHFVVLKNLLPDTTYYYRIISNDELVSTGGENEPFTVRTVADSVSAANLSPAYGKVVSQNGDPLVNNFVLLELSNAYPLMSLTKNTGEWLIPLQYLINKEDARSIAVTEDTIVSIRFFNESQQSVVKATLSQTHPIPQTVIMGTNYTFLEEKVLSASNKQKQSTSSQHAVELQYPKNGAVIPGNTPLVKGKGIPGAEVTIAINSRPAISAKTKVDKSGSWDITISRSIAPGTYTISMVTQDSRNRAVEIKRNFTLIKSGEQVLAESTGSATLTPSVTVRPSVSVTPITSVSPSVSVSPTTIAQLPTPTDEVIIGDLSPTLTPPPPVSGISMIPFMFAGIGLLLLGGRFSTISLIISAINSN